MNSDKTRTVIDLGPALRRVMDQARIGEPDFPALYSVARTAEKRKRSLRAHVYRAIPLAVAASLTVALGLVWNSSYSKTVSVRLHRETAISMAKLAIDQYSIVSPSEADEYAASLFEPSRADISLANHGFGAELAAYIDDQSENMWTQ